MNTPPTGHTHLRPRNYDSRGRLQMAEGSPEKHHRDGTPSNNRFLVHHYDQPDPPRHPHLSVHTHADTTPRRVDLSEVTNLPTRNVRAVLECAGNGRGLRTKRAAGNQFGLGMFSQSGWTGASLRDVLSLAGVEPQDDWTHIVVSAPDRGVTQPENVDASFAKGLPREKALHPDTLVAWQLDDAPIPDEHGGPLRLVVPGWYGIWWVKWVQDITLSHEPFRGFWQHQRYTYQDQDGNVLEVVERHRARALITAPGDGAVVDDDTVLSGLAWGGEGGIHAVQISFDDGQTWLDTELDAGAGSWAWTPWRALIPAGLPRGLNRAAVRAIDRTGFVQPWEQPQDRLGYGNNAIHQIGVDLVATGQS